MGIATGSFEEELTMVLFARLPEQLNDEERRMKYDEPLTAAMREGGLGGSVRGFSQVGDDGRVEWVGIESNLQAMHDCEFVVKRLFELGAPANTRVEIETGEAFIELDVRDWAVP